MEAWHTALETRHGCDNECHLALIEQWLGLGGSGWGWSVLGRHDVVFAVEGQLEFLVDDVVLAVS